MNKGQQCHVAKSIDEQSKSFLFQTTSSTLHLPTTVSAAAKFISSSSSDSDPLETCGRPQEGVILGWIIIVIAAVYLISHHDHDFFHDNY
jgi:hypothetical protein